MTFSSPVSYTHLDVYKRQLLNRDQYGDRPLLYGAQYSAPPEGVKEKKVWYLDEDGKYKTATVLTLSLIHI